MLLNQLEELLNSKSKQTTNTYQVLHEIAEKIHRRSLIFLFTDMFQADKNEEELFEALRHLKYNKHEVVLFHTYDGKLELTLILIIHQKDLLMLKQVKKLIYMQILLKKVIKISRKYFNELKLNVCNIK